MRRLVAVDRRSATARSLPPLSLRTGALQAGAEGRLHSVRDAVVAAHDEEDVIERRLANLLALDYPPELLEIVVASDASTDRTDELVEAVATREPRVRLLRCPREGKVAAQNRAVPTTQGEILAFSDANAQWQPDALRKLVRNFADPEVAYVCGSTSTRLPTGRIAKGHIGGSKLAAPKRVELGSITGGIGAIYTVRRSDYVDVDPRFGHDLALPYLMVQNGRRAVYDAEALASEKPSRDIEDEYRRKVRMFEHCWLIVLRGKMLRGLGPTYLLEFFRTGTCATRVACCISILLGSSIALVGEGLVYQIALGFQLLLAARRGARCRDRALLRPRHLGNRRVARALSPLRRAGRVGQGGRNTMNRLADAAVAGIGLALASPFLAAAAAAIKLDDGGPVFYRQRRVGLNGEEFALVKFRTMEVGAEHKGAGYAVNEGDPRITRVGRLLRRLSIDEIPQLWNVVSGDMSLIGPRPTLAYQVERYTPRQRRRLEVKPGITGWAQIHGRARLPWDERIELDVWYVEHRSPWLDLKILARTPQSLFAGTYKGEYRRLELVIPFFSGANVRQAVSPERALEAVRDAFIAYARGEWTMPSKVYVPAYPAGDFRAMPALGGGHALLKWVTSFPGNPELGLPTVTGLVVLSDATNGMLKAVLDAALSPPCAPAPRPSWRPKRWAVQLPRRPP